ncbi:uncharacterized protein BO97DRAFT_405071 [Aspergillus homomorphus CBS 101889]|uniref:Uncharacterized protein n=1 Tax=Aspergillus homomorphus (strain CBS 101889) TaxID=1450537 RepID=A0A395I215_ASPHC|nr:hypothetical protein BO97DRAFT_405071 [Aspergillus homomorphus CBS 101889]RAL13218.1 hypothetical protein BO97DRAFT_405071 [Aspergillus homomorphus CBS 101889]
MRTPYFIPVLTGSHIQPLQILDNRKPGSDWKVTAATSSTTALGYAEAAQAPKSNPPPCVTSFHWYSRHVCRLSVLTVAR